MAGVYVHLPFCPYICPYCDFAKWPHKRSAAARYLQALYAETDVLCHPDASIPQHRAASKDGRACRGREGFTSVFLGGGTPNTYTASDIAELVKRLREAFPGPEHRETTIEVNPDLVGLDRLGHPSTQPCAEASKHQDDKALDDLRVYREAGINRLSIGVQSFDAQEIRTLGRRHTVEDVERVVRAGREARIGSISIDLMFAVPGQTAQTWRDSLRTAVALGVDHISAYGLTVEEGTRYEQWRVREPSAFFDDAREAELYEIAMDELERAGFEQYEISNFAKPGHRSVHNANYWENGEYIGLGVGAASYRSGVRSVHTRDLEAYIAAATARERIPHESEQLEGARAAGEAVMLALRTSQGVCLDSFKVRYGLDFLHFYAPVVERYRDLGLLETDATHARLTRHGRLLANDVCAAFVTFA